MKQNAERVLRVLWIFYQQYYVGANIYHTKIKQTVNNKQPQEFLLQKATIGELLALFCLMHLAALTHSNIQNLSDMVSTDDTSRDIP